MLHHDLEPVAPADRHAFCAAEIEWGSALMDSHLTLGRMIRISINDSAPAATIANPDMMGVRFPVIFIEDASIRVPS